MKKIILYVVLIFSFPTYQASAASVSLGVFGGLEAKTSKLFESTICILLKVPSLDTTF